MSNQTQAAPLLKVNDIHVYYGAIHAIKGISLEVHENEIVTLIGANGAGKSTTLNTISGLLKPRQGTIEMNGSPIQGVSASKMVFRGLALCPEGRRIFQQMTVRENLEMGAYSRPNTEIEASLEEMFQRFPRLKEREKQIAGTLSGGEQQMLAMARALMSRPKLLMLDEPSMGLAPILVEQIFDIIAELHQSGVTILLVEQNAQMALRVADRAYVMETGLITMQGPAEELLHNDAVQKAYLGS
ncbi:MAG: ABC transporter ATP-binding protein [Clostridia bacterium]|nr:ABC transporter ATP-binding protein [Clostridia bacterium]